MPIASAMFATFTREPALHPSTAANRLNRHRIPHVTQQNRPPLRKIRRLTKWPKVGAASGASRKWGVRQRRDARQRKTFIYRTKRRRQLAWHESTWCNEPERRGWFESVGVALISSRGAKFHTPRSSRKTGRFCSCLRSDKSGEKCHILHFSLTIQVELDFWLSYLGGGRWLSLSG